MLGGAPSLLRAAPRRWRARWQESCSPRRVSGGVAWSCRARALQFKEVRDVREARANGCRNDAYAKPAKGNHGLAACKTLGFSPRPTLLIVTARGTTPDQHDALVVVREEPDFSRPRRGLSAAALKSALSRAPRAVNRRAALRRDRREAAEPAAGAAEHRCAQSPASHIRDHERHGARNRKGRRGLV